MSEDRREFKVRYAGLPPSATFNVPHQLRGSMDSRRSESWLRRDLYEWVEHKRKEAHVNLWLRYEDLDITFFDEAHAVEYVLLWESEAQ